MRMERRRRRGRRRINARVQVVWRTVARPRPLVMVGEAMIEGGGGSLQVSAPAAAAAAPAISVVSLLLGVAVALAQEGQMREDCVGSFLGAYEG
jgi:hypothetical protein